MHTGLAVLALALASTQQQSAGPSFECTRARNPAEQLVCSDRILARLDAQLDDRAGVVIRIARDAKQEER